MNSVSAAVHVVTEIAAQSLLASDFVTVPVVVSVAAVILNVVAVEVPCAQLSLHHHK